MKYSLFICVLGVFSALVVGCTPERDYQPGLDYPEWAYDKPTYYQPDQEPVPFIEGVNGRPNIYFSKQRIVFIKRPEGIDTHKAPRPAVYATKDNGQTWDKIGYFGLEQPYFAFQVKEDGNYGVCILTADHPELGSPNLRIQQVHVIDSKAPDIQISITPEEGPYWVGQRILLSWSVSDPHLDKAPAKLYSRVGQVDRLIPWELRKDDLPANGSASIVIEQIPDDAQGVLFRIEAVDQMGNISVEHTAPVDLLPSTQSAPASKEEKGTEQREDKSTSTIIVPAIEPQSEVAAVEPRPAPAPKRTVAPEAVVPGAIVQAEPDSVSPQQQPDQAQSPPGSELAELEELLAGVSGPVFQGKVQKETPASEPLVQAAGPSAAKPSTERAVAAEPSAPKKTSPAEAGGVLIPPLVLEPSPSPAEPIVTVRPPPEPSPVVEPIAQAKPAVETVVAPVPSSPAEPVLVLPPIVAIESAPATPVPQPTVELPPVVAAEPSPVVEFQPPAPVVTAPPAPTPMRTTAQLSHGKSRMAKPWERLGNRAVAARDFYKHAPTLSNY